ncbi:cation:proton antiporter [Streptomyces sp. L7]
MALQSTGLVLATAVAVAAVAHTLGYGWPIAFVLGAVLAPTDAAAVAAVARAMPRRILTVLRTESLLNDGTALVLLAVTHRCRRRRAPLLLVRYGARLRRVVHRRHPDRCGRRPAPDPGQAPAAGATAAQRPERRDSLRRLLLPAELLHVSGVLAVVVCGLVSAWFGPRVIGSEARIQAVAFWEVASYLLNGALFVLVGIQLPASVRALTSVSLLQATTAGLAVSVAVLGTRLLWFYSVPLSGTAPRPAPAAAGPPDHRPATAAAGLGRNARRDLAGRRTDRARDDRRGTCRRDSATPSCSSPRSSSSSPSPCWAPPCRPWSAGPRFPADTDKSGRTHSGTLPVEQRRARRPAGAGGAVRGARGGHRAPGPGHRGPYRPLHPTPRTAARACATFNSPCSRSNATPSPTCASSGRIDDIVLRSVQEVLDVEELRLGRP